MEVVCGSGLEYMDSTLARPTVSQRFEAHLPTSACGLRLPRCGCPSAQWNYHGTYIGLVLDAARTSHPT